MLLITTGINYKMYLSCSIATEVKMFAHFGVLHVFMVSRLVDICYTDGIENKVVCQGMLS